MCWCWTFDDGEVEAATLAIQSAAGSCFGDRPYGLIGFSNGGYLLSKLLRACALPAKLSRARWMVSVGSAMFKGPLEPRPGSLAGCGQLTLLIGTRDQWNFDPADHFLQVLKAKGAAVDAVRFDGAHELPGPALQRVLEARVAR